MDTSINTNISINIKNVLQGIAALETEHLHNFANEVMQLLTKRSADDEQLREWAIIAQIYTLVPASKMLHYEVLVEKAEAEELSQEERQEYIARSEEMEAFSVKRLKLLIELAKIRKVDVSTVIKQLGLEKHIFAENV